MQLDSSKYDRPVIESNHKFADKLEIVSALKKFVAFRSSMKKPRHRWFHYKQGFSPELVEYLLCSNHIPKKSFVDPFCGVGTGPIVAASKGLDAFGFDISPLAIEVCLGKISNPDKKQIERRIDKFLSNCQLYQGKISEYYLNKSFDEVTLRELLGMRDGVIKEFEGDNKRFLLLCLLSIFNEFAHVKRDGGFLRFVKKDFFPETKVRLKQVVLDYLGDIDSYQVEIPYEFVKKRDIVFEVCDARNIPLESNAVGMVVTSPPYLNRYDYTRIYALELALLGYSDDFVKELRKKTVKSHIEATHKHFPKLESAMLTELMEKLGNSQLSNPKIPEMVNGYFHDMAWNIKESQRITAAEGVIAYVIGNCRFSGHHVEVDSILAEIGQSFGLTVESILVVKTRGSSVQQVRKYGDLPLRESIVIFRRI